MERADFLRVRSEGRGTRRSPANVLRVALAHRPPDCRPKEPQVTQNAPNARRPIARNPSVLVQPLPPVMDELTLGGPGRSGRCTRRVADSDSHWKRQFTRAARRPQRPALPRRPCGPARSGRPDASFCDQGPPRAPGRQTRARCVRRAALGRRASNSAPPPSLGHAPIPPDSSISKSGPRDLEFEYPVVVFKVERARYKVDTRGESSTTKACSRHGFAGHARFDRSKNSIFSATAWVPDRRRGR